MRSYISLDGIMSYLESQNIPLFSDVSLPAGIDRETLVNTIYQDGAEFGVIYPDPIFLRSSVNAWFNTKYNTFSKWYAVLNMEYNPIENYDRMEAWNDTGTVSDTGVREDTGTSRDTTESTTTLNATTEGNTETTTHSESETTTTVSAFNDGDYQPHDKVSSINETTTNSEDSEIREDVTRYDEEKNGQTTFESHTTGERTTGGEHSGRIHGNIGVVTSQAMVEAEIELRRNYNIYNMISDCFCDEFLIQVY